jgi:DNA transformation protein and related proteins
MPVSPDYLEYVLEQLEPVRASARKMFGGAGLYIDGIFFALVDDDVLFLKSDQTTRQDFLDRGSVKWSPPGMEATFGYLSCPPEVLEDPDELATWARRACDVALRKKAAKPSRKKA